MCRRLGIYRLPKNFLLSVVMPVYNEARTIEEVIGEALDIHQLLADLPGDREAEPRLPGRRGTILTAARFGFEDEDGRCASRALADPQVFRTLLQRRHARGGARSCLRLGHAPPIAAAAASCRQALATLRAPPGHHSAATGGRHALAETMPALAHELARLVGPFHVGSPLVPSPVSGDVAAGAVQIGPASTRAQAAPHS